MNSSKKPKFNLTNVETRLLELMEEMKQLARGVHKDDIDQGSP